MPTSVFKQTKVYFILEIYISIYIWLNIYIYISKLSLISTQNTMEWESRVTCIITITNKTEYEVF